VVELARSSRGRFRGTALKKDPGRFGLTGSGVLAISPEVAAKAEALVGEADELLADALAPGKWPEVESVSGRVQEPAGCLGLGSPISTAGPSRPAERLGRCPSSRATGTTMRASTPRPDSSFESAISSAAEKRSLACATIQSVPNVGRTGGKS